MPFVCRYGLEVDADMVVCQLTTSKTQCLLLAVFYRPPNAGESFLESFKNSLEKACVTGIADLVITRDFNFPCVDWSNGLPTIADNSTKLFCEILDDYFLIQTNCHITRPNYA